MGCSHSLRGANRLGREPNHIYSSRTKSMNAWNYSCTAPMSQLRTELSSSFPFYEYLYTRLRQLNLLISSGNYLVLCTLYYPNTPGSNPGGDEIFRPSRPALEPTQPPVQ